MRLVSLLVLALVACKSNKASAPTAGSATAAAPAPKSAATPAAAPRATPAPTYVAPEAPEGEVVPAQAQGSAGSAVAPPIAHDMTVRVFDKLDANHDGKLTPDEVSKRFPGDVDLNGDGEISKDELAAAMREQRIGGRARVKP